MVEKYIYLPRNNSLYGLNLDNRDDFLASIAKTAAMNEQVKTKDDRVSGQDCLLMPS